MVRLGTRRSPYPITPKGIGPSADKSGQGASSTGHGVNLHVASRQSHPVVPLARATFAGLVLIALLVTIAHNTVHLGPPNSYFIEEWVYDFITMSAALATLARAALRREERSAWALLGIGLLSWAIGDLYWT